MTLTVSEKRQLIYIGAAFLSLVILWLLLRRVTNNSVKNEQLGDNVFGDVIIPDFDFGDFGLPISIPGVYAGSRDYEMISGCCSDCAGSVPVPNYAPSKSATNLNFIFNEGQQGARYYMNTAGVPQQPQASISQSYGRGGH